MSLQPVRFLLLGMWILATLGSSALAQSNPFETDYTNCPVHLRLDAVTGLVIRHPHEEGDLQTDKLEVAWHAPNPPLGQVLGGNNYTAVITVILEGPGEPLVQHAPLGVNLVTFDNTALASDWKVSVAVTDRQHVISHIAQ